MAYAGAHSERLSCLVINDIGPDVEAGIQRVTQTVGSRPEEFATLDDAMAYRRQAMPGMATRSVEDQRKVALGCFGNDQMAGGSGRWTRHTSSSE
jgi:hypothetical protein